MVFSGKKKGGGDRQPSEEENMEKLKPLHNFDLPQLKWGNRKLLRCINVDSINPSPEIGTRRQDSEFEQRFRSSNDNVSSSEKATARIGVAGNGDIEATREKLMFDFQKEVGEMKNAILGERPPSDHPTERPWNLRTRRAPSNGNGDGDVLKPNCSSPVRNESKARRVIISGQKRERAKFSVSVSRREMEEDFMAMTGRRLPRKPKKRPRIVQKQLDTLFPGLWLSEITADMYKVLDEPKTRKR